MLFLVEFFISAQMIIVQNKQKKWKKWKAEPRTTSNLTFTFLEAFLKKMN